MNTYKRRIEIEDIKTLEDIEMFFPLLTIDRVGFHPEVSFHEYITVEKIDGKLNNRGRSLSKEECDRLDMLMDKCCDLADKSKFRERFSKVAESVFPDN
jgi:hypothetical protein